MNKSVNKFGRKAADEFTGKSVRNFAEESECRTDEKFVQELIGENGENGENRVPNLGEADAELCGEIFAGSMRRHMRKRQEKKFYQGFYSVSRDALFP